MVLGFISLFFLISDDKPVKNGKFESPSLIADSTEYVITKNSLELERQNLYKKYLQNSITLDSVSVIFTNRLVNDIIPYWYGTEWDFNGYTDVPGKGLIACGYFVSTTLKHAGVRVNRFKMAQKSAMGGALMLESKSNLDIERTDRDSFIRHFLSDKEDGLYMLGLSYHVGYLYKVNDEAYFIHSTYLYPGKVVCEKALDSEAMSTSTIFVLADLTHNHTLMLKWLKGEILPH